jgi:transcriptional regulator with XRE-family HTH domain
MEPLGQKIRKHRHRLGLTLNDLSGRAGISKPYLSLIETGRVPNPPSDEKLRRLEATLGFAAGELVAQAHLQKTPNDVRAVLGKLLGQNGVGNWASAAPASDGNDEDLSADFSKAFHQMATQNHGENEDPLRGGAVPMIDHNFSRHPANSDNSRQFVGCPEICDKQAFAARVQGDSMIPRYRQGDIVIFAPSLPARDGDDCFVKFSDGQTTFKRIFFEVDSEGRAPVVRLQPRNERYRARVVKNEEVSVMYRAVYRYQRVDGD